MVPVLADCMLPISHAINPSTIVPVNVTATSQCSGTPIVVLCQDGKPYHCMYKVYSHTIHCMTS